ncbi:hypothetical protein CH262_12480 [Rhodococcus sp. 05-2255-1e]|nr:hypothetical protein CH262_12480 [Rhodococcus sp. 05-2255-1e]
MAVPDGIAISNGMYDKDLSYDLPATAITPMGMNKNNAQTLANKTWTDITSWVVRSGFAGTVIANDGLVVAQPMRANISVVLSYARPSGTYVAQSTSTRILINGVIAKESAIEGTGTSKVGLTIDVKAGDVIKVQGWTNFARYTVGLGFINTTLLSATLNAGTGTYVSFSKAKLGAVDFQNDLVFEQESKFIEKDNGVFVMPNGKKKALPLNRITASWSGSISNNVRLTKSSGNVTDVDITSTPSGSNSITNYSAVSLGPVLAQSKIPYPVSEGMLVNFGGTLMVRRSGTAERTEEDAATGMKVRFALWGKGKDSTEYGDIDVDLELIWFEAELQASGSLSKTTQVYTIPAMADAVVPPNISQVYFTAALKQTAVDDYASATFENAERAGSNAAYFGTSFSDPLYIKLELPSAEQNTYRHPLSSTGVALKNRKYFDNMQRPKALTFFGNNSAVSLDIYKSSNRTRGSLIGTFAASAGERKTVVIESDTGQIELVSSDPYWVESCKPISYDTLDETQTTLERIEWTDISEPLNSIVAGRDEYAISKMQLSFVSDSLANSNLLMPGKRVRMLINHYGNSPIPTSMYGDTYSPSYAASAYNVAFTGMIRDYRVKYDYRNRPFIEVTVEDAHRSLADTDGKYMYDLPEEYAPMLNGLGHSVTIDGIDVSGSWRNKTDSSKNQPSAFVDGMKVDEALASMRNSRKGFVYVDRFNVICYKSTLDTQPKLTLADSFARGDISYSKLDKGTDTEAVINQVKPSEYRVDLDELKKRTVDSDLPAQIEPIQTLNETSQWWYDQQSIRSYGAREATFPVVRGTGKIEDIRNGELGPGFHDWADAIMDDYVLAKNKVSRVMIIPDNFYDLKRLSELDIFDAVKIIWKNEQHVCFIRKMEWTIADNHVRLELFFSRERSGVAWTPLIVPGESYADIYFDIY